MGMDDEKEKPNKLAKELFDEITRGETLNADGTRANRHSRRREEREGA